MINSNTACHIKCKVISNTEITRGVFYLTFERPYEFEAGQLISLTTDPSITPRLYSIASGVNDKEIGILFDLKPEGLLTNILAKLSTGDEITISRPYGSFIGNNEPAVWIATGTGIAPFVAMAKSGMGSGKTLIQGARTLDGFYFAKLFSSIDGFHYTRCCTKESAADVYNGRLTDYLRESSILALKEKYYLCGNPLMVNDVRDILIERGVPYENILSEIFF